jgi:hypothetical protein
LMSNSLLYEVKKKKDSEKSFSQPGPVPRHQGRFWRRQCRPMG